MVRQHWQLQWFHRLVADNGDVLWVRLAGR